MSNTTVTTTSTTITTVSAKNASRSRVVRMIDLHAHILPGLDDGAADWEEAVEMARLAVASGTTGMFATPHWLEDEITPEPAKVQALLNELRRRLAEAAIPLTVWPGMEVYLTPILPRLLREGRLLTLNNQKNHLLVELPLGEWPACAEQTLFELQVAGVTPVLAHPERSRAVIDDPTRLEKVVAQGALVQVNAGSLTGQFGRRVQRCAEEMVKRGLVHFLGSDAHSCGQRGPSLAEAAERLERLLGRVAAEKITRLNAANLLAGQSIESYRPHRRNYTAGNVWQRLKKWATAR
ncbi:MAG: hypothetical protein HPY81_07535 [Firmicutes bacterium]|nr:hypothetical protein [Bacillota bacterium]